MHWGITQTISIINIHCRYLNTDSALAILGPLYHKHRAGWVVGCVHQYCQCGEKNSIWLFCSWDNDLLFSHWLLSSHCWVGVGVGWVSNSRVVQIIIILGPFLTISLWISPVNFKCQHKHWFHSWLNNAYLNLPDLE